MRKKCKRKVWKLVNPIAHAIEGAITEELVAKLALGKNLSKYKIETHAIHRDLGREIQMASNPKVVCLGGGHGLAATLAAMRTLTNQVTAVVTVADNGGSSGRLRAEFNSLPPGDLRVALAALCADDEWGRSWAEIMQYRFTSSGQMDNHAVGNLLLTALWDRDHDPVKGLERVGQLLEVVGRVLPMALEPLDIEGKFTSNQKTELVRGQIQVAAAAGKVNDLS